MEHVSFLNQTLVALAKYQTGLIKAQFGHSQFGFGHDPTTVRSNASNFGRCVLIWWAQSKRDHHPPSHSYDLALFSRTAGHAALSSFSNDVGDM